MRLARSTSRQPAKTKRARSVRLDVCPSVVGALGKAGKGRVFAAWDYRTALKWSEANDVDWRTCHRTCATYSCALTTLGPWQSSRRLGHSVQIAEKHYAGLVRVSPDVTTLEAAIGLAD